MPIIKLVSIFPPCLPIGRTVKLYFSLWSLFCLCLVYLKLKTRYTYLKSTTNSMPQWIADERTRWCRRRLPACSHLTTFVADIVRLTNKFHRPPVQNTPMWCVLYVLYVRSTVSLHSARCRQQMSPTIFPATFFCVGDLSASVNRRYTANSPIFCKGTLWLPELLMLFLQSDN